MTMITDLAFTLKIKPKYTQKLIESYVAECPYAQKLRNSKCAMFRMTLCVENLKQKNWQRKNVTNAITSTGGYFEGFHDRIKFLQFISICTEFWFWNQRI